MSLHTITILDGSDVHTIEAAVADGSVRVDPAALTSALGWELRPEGLCRGDVCVPVDDRAGLETDDGIDLAALARCLDRPLAVDHEERVAALGGSARERALALTSLEAPDFTLPDLDGRMHSLSGHRGRKVLLVAYASW